MTTLHISKLDDEIIQGLQAHAELHQISIEEAVRGILSEALFPSVSVGDLASEFFGSENSIKLTLPKREVYKPLQFD